MNDYDFTEKIKQMGRDLGFDLVGITDTSNPNNFQLYKEWIEGNNHGEMKYLSSERALTHRTDLQKVLPGCKSVIILAKRINPSYQDESKMKYQGRVASYAWNLDYHDTFLPLLSQLAQKIEGLAGRSINYKYYTDTGPVLERELASRAGLGWIGKNSMLINPDIGSFFLISEILLDIDLTPDLAFEQDFCGKCRKCIDACPTNCILPNRTIDSKRCLSYLTIELKTETPLELRTKMNEWIFGCDICQQVCPWNRHRAKNTEDANFSPRIGVPKPDLLSDLKLIPEEFNKKFKNSPVKRTKRRGYLRSIVTYLGNTKSIDLIPHLTPLLINEQEILIRQHAAWAIGQIGGEQALNILKDALSSETEDQVIFEIKLAIAEINQLSS